MSKLEAAIVQRFDAVLRSASICKNSAKIKLYNCPERIDELPGGRGVELPRIVTLEDDVTGESPLNTGGVAEAVECIIDIGFFTRYSVMAKIGCTTLLV
jgi:hypothetical protein